MAERPEEEEFVCVVEKLQQQEDKIELKFQMKFGQQLLTMSSIMACPLEEHHWAEGHCHSARSEGCQYHHVCCHLQ